MTAPYWGLRRVTFSLKGGLSQNPSAFTNAVEEVGTDVLVHRRHRAITTWDHH